MESALLYQKYYILTPSDKYLYIENIVRKITDRKAVAKNADKSENMQEDSIDIATQAIKKFTVKKDITPFTKKL